MNHDDVANGTLTGYANQISIAPGGSLRCMVSCSEPIYTAELVRLLHGDPHPNGPGLREEILTNPINANYPGRLQTIRAGSYVKIEHCVTLRSKSGISLQAWVLPTTPGKGLECIISKWNGTPEAGYGLFIGENGCLSLGLVREGKSVEWVTTGRVLRAGCWYFLAATFDFSSGMVRLWQCPVSKWKEDPSRVQLEQATEPGRVSETNNCVCIAAFVRDCKSQPTIAGHFNGKIDSPTLFNRALDPEEIEALYAGLIPASSEDSLLGDWDFSIGMEGDRIIDCSPHAHHGMAVNMPARAVTGYNWRGEMFSRFQDAVHSYGAIHFHDDDLEDACWEEDFTLQIPQDFESGIYAVKLKSEDQSFHIPYIVRRGDFGKTSPVVFLAPTFTWQAYANFNEIANRFNLESSESSPWLFEDRFIAAHPELGVSLYDLHSDGSTPYYSSRLRPNLSGGPSYTYAPLASSHLLAADLSITAWLHAIGQAFDVIADDDLNREGSRILKPYRVMITGAHPEYWSGGMLDALETFLNEGGNLMYLGGNGLYWVTSVHPTRPIIEVRRSLGTGLTRAPDGELYHSTTGELGGIWRTRGRAPHMLLGVGFCAQGGTPGCPYHRRKDSFDPRAAFIFQGIGGDEVIGDFGLCTRAAGGFEIDRLDYSLGTPENTLLLASSQNHEDSYWHVTEETTIPGIHECGARSPKIQAHMTYYEHPGGGGVFSTGSIAWSGALSHNDYQNNVSRITGNVLRKFAVG